MPRHALTVRVPKPISKVRRPAARVNAVSRAENEARSGVRSGQRRGKASKAKFVAP